MFELTRHASEASRKASAKVMRPRTKLHLRNNLAADDFVQCWINRPAYGLTFHAMRLEAWKFWLQILGAQVALILVGVFCFAVVGRQGATKAVDLSLQSVGLSIREQQCTDHVAICRYASALLGFAERIYEWLVSALVIARVFRGVVRKRWTFDRHAILADGELQLRYASMHPSICLGMTFTVEAILKPWRHFRRADMPQTGRGDAAAATWIFRGGDAAPATRIVFRGDESRRRRGRDADVRKTGARLRYQPLSLTNGGTLAMMSDVAITLRHKVDEDSPFSDPNWRDNIVGISVTAQGFDELVAEDCAVNQFISVDHIIDDGRLHANIMQNYNIEVRETTKTTPALRRRHVTFDYSKLHQLVGRGHGERRGAVDASDGAPSTRTTVDHRTGLET